MSLLWSFGFLDFHYYKYFAPLGLRTPTALSDSMAMGVRGGFMVSIRAQNGVEVFQEN